MYTDHKHNRSGKAATYRQRTTLSNNATTTNHPTTTDSPTTPTTQQLSGTQDYQLEHQKRTPANPAAQTRGEDQGDNRETPGITPHR